MLIYIMASQQQSTGDIGRNVQTFVEKSEIVKQALGTLNPADKASLEKQLITFADDIDKMRKGKLSYADMRAMYG